MRELERVSTTLEGNIDAVLTPVDEVDAILATFSSLASRLNLDAGGVVTLIIAAIQGQPLVAANGVALDSALVAEVHGFADRLLRVLAALEATPERVAKLTAQLAQAVVMIPKLVIEVQADAQVTSNNPFAGADAKAAASADLQALGQVQTNIIAKIQEAQVKVATLPQRALQALQQFMASLGPNASNLLALAKAKAAPGARAVATRIAVAAAAGGTVSLQAGGQAALAYSVPGAGWSTASAPSVGGKQYEDTRGVTSGGSAALSAIDELRAIREDLERRVREIDDSLSEINAAAEQVRDTADRLQVAATVLGTTIAADLRGEALTHPDGMLLEPQLAAEIQGVTDLLRNAVAATRTVRRNAGLLQLTLIDDWDRTQRLAPSATQQARGARFVVVDGRALQHEKKGTVAAMQSVQTHLAQLPAQLHEATRALLENIPGEHSALMAAAALPSRQTLQTRAVVRASGMMPPARRFALQSQRTPVAPLPSPHMSSEAAAVAPAATLSQRPNATPSSDVSDPEALGASEASSTALSTEVNAPPVEDGLTREQVVTSMNVAKAALGECVRGMEGQVLVGLVIAGATGRVTRATARLDAALRQQIHPTPEISITRLVRYHEQCMEKALKVVLFPSFGRAEMTIQDVVILGNASR